MQILASATNESRPTGVVKAKKGRQSKGWVKMVNEANDNDGGVEEKNSVKWRIS